MRFVPHDYQREAIRYLLDRESAGLFLDPGLGKTSIILSAINSLRRLGLIEKTLVVAPLRVCYSVWPREIEKWDCFKGLRVSIVHGNQKARRRALAVDADLYLINPEGLVWLYKELKDLAWIAASPFDMLVVDESTKFKSPSSRRWKALKALLPIFKRSIIGTGTPSPNSLEDLWSQLFILDRGERLGSCITHYRNRYFYRSGFQGREFFPFTGAKEAIEERIADIVLRLDAKDLIELPELVVNDIFVSLPRKTLLAYKRLERSLLFEIERESYLDPDEGVVEAETFSVEAMSAAAKYLLARQIANGGFYVDEIEIDGAKIRSSEVAHNEKIDAIEDLRDELAGKPLLVAYHFRHDLERLRARFGKRIPNIGGGVSPRETDSIVSQWNEGKLPLLFVQPMAMSHGLNMQGAGNDIAWLGLTDDLEVYLQTNARIWRQGATGSRVRIHRILASSTVDLAVRRRIDSKEATQKSLLDALKAYREDVTQKAGVF